MSAPPALDDAGRLRIAEPTLAVLLAHAADPVAAAVEDPDAVEQLTALQAAGVISGGAAHPSVAPALSAMLRPDLCTLELAYSGRAMTGWASHATAALLLPEEEDGDGLRTLVGVHPTLLPEALARLVDLGPRPRPSASTPVAAGEVGGERRRWRLSAAWTLDDGTNGGAALEVLDAESGLWLVEDGGLAFPVTATFVWRHIVRLIMRRV